eukprot:Skav213740  [mRNA]  locus=scaffold19:87687:88736:- [translate_table: standard]
MRRSIQRNKPCGNELRLGSKQCRPPLELVGPLGVWPLASTLLCGEYLIKRCRDLKVSVVLYDPMTPHGLLVAQKLKIPKASLVTYPGMGSLSDLLSHADRVRRGAHFRAPYGRKERCRWVQEWC